MLLRTGPKPSIRGFTLAEVIIVIFIIALVSGLLLIRAASTSPVRVSERVAKQIHSFLRVTQEQAILQPAVLGLSMTKEGYQVLELTDTAQNLWQPLSAKAQFWRPHLIDPNIEITLFINQQQMNIPLLLSQAAQPQITFLPSGEMTPFELFIQHRAVPMAYRIAGNFAGQLDMSEVN